MHLNTIFLIPVPVSGTDFKVPSINGINLSGEQLVQYFQKLFRGVGGKASVSTSALVSWFWKCVFCNHLIHWKDFTKECGSNLKYLGPFDCPKCKFEGVIKTDDRWVCLSCCNTWVLEDVNVCKLF